MLPWSVVVWFASTATTPPPALSGDAASRGDAGGGGERAAARGTTQGHAAAGIPRVVVIGDGEGAVPGYDRAAGIAVARIAQGQRAAARHLHRARAGAVGDLPALGHRRPAADIEGRIARHRDGVAAI